MKIVELQIDDSVLSGIDAVALVEAPAIETDFVAFNKVSMAEMTFDDYPQKAIENAKRGIEINKELGNKCATQVGKVRAQQLANGEKLSLDTIQRMRSFLIRQKGNYELAIRRKDYEACGYISYLLWGGEEALPWAEKKLRQAGIEFNKFNDYLIDEDLPPVLTNEPQTFEQTLIDAIIANMLGIEWDFNININALPNFVNEASTGKKNKFSAELAEKQMLVGPLMTAGKLIPRMDENGEEYQVFFSKETIEKLAYKLMEDKLIDSVNIEHDPLQPAKDVYLVESWIVKDPEHDKATLYGFKPNEGDWYGMYKIKDRTLWNEYVKSGKVKGFSVEGIFTNNILTNK